MSSVDLQLIDIMKWGVEDICRCWLMPPRMVGHYHAGLRQESRMSGQSEDFERWTIRGHALRDSSQMTFKLLTHNDRHVRRLRIRADTSRIARGSLGERIEQAARGYADGGVYTLNEARRELDLPPKPNGDEVMTPRGAAAAAPDHLRAQQGAKHERKRYQSFAG